MQKALVVTTINKPNTILESMAFEANKRGIHFIIIGDTKTPNDFKITGVDYYTDIDKEEGFLKRIFKKRF